MKILSIVFMSVAALASVGCKKKAGGGDALAKLTAFTDQMCACKDKECATKVTDAMTKYATEAAKTAGANAQATSADDAKKLAEIGRKLGECTATAMTGGTTTPQAGTDAGSAAAGSGSAAADKCAEVPAFVLAHIAVNTSRDNVEENSDLGKAAKPACKEVEIDGKKVKRCTLSWSKPGAITATFEDHNGTQHARYITTSAADADKYLTTNEDIGVGNPLSVAKTLYGDCLKQEGNVWSVRQNLEPDADIMEFTVGDGDVITKVTLRGITEAL